LILLEQKWKLSMYFYTSWIRCGYGIRTRSSIVPRESGSQENSAIVALSGMEAEWQFLFNRDGHI
jgi:hypothetical protein